MIDTTTIIAASFSIWMFVSLGVGIHANERGKTPMWGALTLLTGFLGMILYAISLASD